MASIFRIRRGSASTMSGAKKDIILAAGELFAEYPDEGMGTGAGRLFLGDGSSPFSELQPFLESSAADLDIETIEVVANTKTTSTAALNDVVSNNTIGSLIGSLKQAVSLVKSELTSSINTTATNASSALTAAKNELNTKINNIPTNTMKYDSSMKGTVTSCVNNFYHDITYDQQDSRNIVVRHYVDNQPGFQVFSKPSGGSYTSIGGLRVKSSVAASSSNDHNIYMRWTNDSFLEVWVDTTCVFKVTGFTTLTRV